MAEEEDLERQLASQLQEQQDSLAAVEEALEDDPEGAELLEVKAALAEGIADTQAALLELKRSRLLGLLDGQQRAAHGDGGAASGSIRDEAPRPEDPAAPAGEASSVGRRCLFRHTDGRWHDGVVRGGVAGTPPVLSVDFLRPTRAHQLGLLNVSPDLARILPASAAQDEVRALVEGGHLEPGALVLARLPDSSGLWGRAEVVEACNSRVIVVFRREQAGAVPPPSGRVSLGIEDVSLRLHPRQHPGDEGSLQEGSDGDEEEGDEEEDLEEEDDDDDGTDEAEDYAVTHRGLGRAAMALASSSDAVQLAAAAGPQTDVAHFAEWEGHTRGIASKMMASMGYISGQGLGRSGSGMALPLEVRLLQPGKGLGADEGRVAEGHGRKRKRKRGGERARQKRHAERTRAAKEARDQRQHEAEMATGTPGVFSFINMALGDASEAAQVVGSAARDDRGAAGGPKPPTSTPTASLWDPASIASSKDKAGSAGARKEAREAGLHLMGNQDKILQIRGKLSRLQEMRQRNANDKVIRMQVDRKIADVQLELAAAEGHQRQAESRASDRAKMKKWMKF